MKLETFDRRIIPLSLLIAALITIAGAMTGCDRPQSPRWQLCDGHFYNYDRASSGQPMSTTFLLDTQTGKVWYATPTSDKYFLTPEFKPVFIDPSTPRSDAFHP